MRLGRWIDCRTKLLAHECRRSIVLEEKNILLIRVRIFEMQNQSCASSLEVGQTKSRKQGGRQWQNIHPASTTVHRTMRGLAALPSAPVCSLISKEAETFTWSGVRPFEFPGQRLSGRLIPSSVKLVIIRDVRILHCLRNRLLSHSRETSGTLIL
jgi:hypothetical protein